MNSQIGNDDSLVGNFFSMSHFGYIIQDFVTSFVQFKANLDFHLQESFIGMSIKSRKISKWVLSIYETKSQNEHVALYHLLRTRLDFISKKNGRRF
jgi:hypothetical protein